MSVHATLARMLDAGKFEPYVQYVRFPRYKNLAPNTKIEFGHPITAIIGPNGVNKTSVLRALYGVPEGMSTGNYWFSTATDAIPGDRATCIHGRKQGKEVVEVLKQRSSAEKTLDYWEPSRPVKAYGMSDMPELREGQTIEGRSNTRWDAIKKDVLYLEASDRISAFDRCFHYGGAGSEKPLRKALIKRRAPVLQNIIDNKFKNFIFHRINRVSHNELLKKPAVDAISKILGRKYESIRWVEHNLYQSRAATVVIKSIGLANPYTEAFAGSGEFAVTQIVKAVLSAKDRTLILLDEPETFLHPFAQSQLMDFLAEQAKSKLHQVVITTHAPAIIRALPSKAIKVLIQSQTGEIEVVAQEAEPDTAFFHIGEPLTGKTTVYVEDDLAKWLVLRALGKDEAVRAKFSVEPLAGGKSALWVFASQFATVDRTDVRFIFDGDAKPIEWPCKSSQAISKQELKSYVSALLRGQDLKFYVNGGSSGGDESQLELLQRKFIDWVRKYVSFLPCTTPEEFILERSSTIPRADGDPKDQFLELAKKRVDDIEVSSYTILTIQREMLAAVPSDDPDLAKLRLFLVPTGHG
jgi:predicted ATPase